MARMYLVFFTVAACLLGGMRTSYAAGVSVGDDESTPVDGGDSPSFDLLGSAVHARAMRELYTDDDDFDLDGPGDVTETEVDFLWNKVFRDGLGADSIHLLTVSEFAEWVSNLDGLSVELVAALDKPMDISLNKKQAFNGVPGTLTVAKMSSDHVLGENKDEMTSLWGVEEEQSAADAFSTSEGRIVLRWRPDEEVLRMELGADLTSLEAIVDILPVANADKDDMGDGGGRAFDRNGSFPWEEDDEAGYGSQLKNANGSNYGHEEDWGELPGEGFSVIDEEGWEAELNVGSEQGRDDSQADAPTSDRVVDVDTYSVKVIRQAALHPATTAPQEADVGIDEVVLTGFSTLGPDARFIVDATTELLNRALVADKPNRTQLKSPSGVHDEKVGAAIRQISPNEFAVRRVVEQDGFSGNFTSHQLIRVKMAEGFKLGGKKELTRNHIETLRYRERTSHSF